MTLTQLGYVVVTILEKCIFRLRFIFGPFVNGRCPGYKGTSGPPSAVSDISGIY